MRILAATILIFCMSHPASASPLTDSIASDLAQKDLEIRADAKQGKYCEARRKADEMVADLNTAVEQTLNGKPIHMQTVKSLGVVASDDDVSWIILQKYELAPIMYRFMFICPR